MGDETASSLIAKERLERALRLVELCRLVVADGDTGLESAVVKVREHLLYQTRLHRIGRDLNAAEQTIALAPTLPNYAFADESRLDFNEPMERLRIAIARGHFEKALTFADEAEKNTGSRSWPGRPTHPAIGLLARAELRFLRGATLLGLDEADPQAQSSVQSAVDAVARSAQSLPENDRLRLLEHCTVWQDILTRPLVLNGESHEK